MTTITDIRAAYEEAKGRWTGCDWLTHYGCLGLDLAGVTSGRAYRAAAHWAAIAQGEVAYDNVTTGEETSLVDMARCLRLKRAVVYLGEDQGGRLEVRGTSARIFCAESVAREWLFAALWLEEVESDAHWAEVEAQQAVQATERGAWDEALWRADMVGLIELDRDGRRTWGRLREAIKEAAEKSTTFQPRVAGKGDRAAELGKA
jgi:hypothetical protein